MAWYGHHYVRSSRGRACSGHSPSGWLRRLGRLGTGCLSCGRGRSTSECQTRALYALRISGRPCWRSDMGSGRRSARPGDASRCGRRDPAIEEHHRWDMDGSQPEPGEIRRDRPRGGTQPWWGGVRAVARGGRATGALRMSVAGEYRTTCARPGSLISRVPGSPARARSPGRMPQAELDGGPPGHLSTHGYRRAARLRSASSGIQCRTRHPCVAHERSDGRLGCSV